MTASMVPNESPTDHSYNGMPDGLSGYWWETDNLVCVPFVQTNHPGDSTFAAWLRELEQKRKVVFFPTVISAHLDALLRARGYTDFYNIGSPEEKALGMMCFYGLGRDFRIYPPVEPNAEVAR